MVKCQNQVFGEHRDFSRLSNGEWLQRTKMNVTWSNHSEVQIPCAAALAEVVREQAARGEPVIDYGRWHRGVGHAPVRRGTVIEYRGEQVEHFTSDFTVRVDTGMTLGRLGQQLANDGQFLPMDGDEAMTLGECIAHNVYGPMRLGYGSLRDLVLGLAFIDAQGNSIVTGGRTVKNVAGYDVSRFMVGNLNELGLLHQTTLRTYAIPSHTLHTTLSCDDPLMVDRGLTRWLLSDAKPTWLLMQASDDGWRLHVGYHGSEKACTRQSRAMSEQLIHLPGVEFENETTGDFQSDAQIRSELRAWRHQLTALAKLVVPANQTGAWVKRLRQHQSSLHIETYPAHGCLWVGGKLDATQVAQLDRFINEGLQGLTGFRVWYQRPGETLEAVKPIAPLPTDWSILRRIKKTMDPQNLFNPGRFLSATLNDAVEAH